MSDSNKYQLPVSSSRDHPSVRKWILNKWGCVVVVATVLYNFLLNGLLFNYNLLFVEFQQEFESSATLTGNINCRNKASDHGHQSRGSMGRYNTGGQVPRAVL